MSLKNNKIQTTLPNQQFLEVKSVTWSKDSHGLFDYQSNNCSSNIFKLKLENLTFFRAKKSGAIIVADTPQQKSELNLIEDNTLLIQLRKQKIQDQTILILQNSNEQSNESESSHIKTQQSFNEQQEHQGIYLIVRSLKNPDGSNKGHPLQIGEKIKLGRVQYSVIQMKIGQNIQSSDSSIHSFFKNDKKFQEDNIKIQKGATCKICIQQNDTPQNFLFTPCKCTGSCQYVHIQCLRKWIEVKVRKEVIGGTVHYNFQKFQCEICKTQLPKYIMKNGLHQLLKIPRPSGDYLILQQLGEDKRDLIIIQNLPLEGIKIGRGHQCQIRVSDISVSRLHAHIKLINNQFYIFDNNSKFGTLIKIKRNIQIGYQKKAFQVGRTVLTFTLKKQKPEKKQCENMNQQQQVIQKAKGQS